MKSDKVPHLAYWVYNR